MFKDNCLRGNYARVIVWRAKVRGVIVLRKISSGAIVRRSVIQGIMSGYLLNAFIMSSSVVMCTVILTTISNVLTVGRHLHMLLLLLGKLSCLNFRVTFLFNPMAGIFELPFKSFGILLIAFSEKGHQCNKRFHFHICL